jgi:hypothetical protein
MKPIAHKAALVALALGLAAGSSVPLLAQTTSTPPTTTTTTATSTCTTAPTSVSALSIERVLTLSNILTTLTRNVSASILASIAGGAEEIRTRLIYNPSANTLTDTTFLVPAGSPLPTPLGVNIDSSIIQTFVLNVTQIFSSCQPTPSLLIVGTIGSAGASAYANFVEAPAAVSLGYTTDTPPLINNVVEVVAGSVLAYSASASGTLSFPAVTVTPPGTTAGNPTIVLNPLPPSSGSFQVFQNPFFVNASGSTDPNNLPLTFTWSSNLPVNFVPSSTVSNPSIYFVSGAGDYTITLTVTNSAGKVSTTSFSVQFLGKS